MRSKVSDAGSYRSRLVLALIASDALWLALGLGVALLVRMQLDEAGVAAEFHVRRHLLASVGLGSLMLLGYWAQGLYDQDQIFSGTREYGRITHGAIYAFLGALAFSYFAGPLNYTNGVFTPILSRSWLLLALVIGALFSMTGRFTARRVVAQMRRRGRLPVRIVIVGASAAGVSIARQFRAARDDGLQVVGFLDEYLPLGEQVLEGIAVIGRPADLLRGRIPAVVDEYVLVSQALPHQRLEEITALMVSRDRPVVRMAVTPSALLTNGVLVAARGQVPLVTLRRARITGLDAILKRSFDIVVAGLALLVLAVPVGIVVVRAAVLGVRPLTRRQQVYGPNGKRPTLRLLSRDAARHVAIRGAPALAGVLAGDLSLVGPRPVPVLAELPQFFAPGLTAVKPGLTGPWRLGGPDATLEEQATRDLAYVRDHTIWEDLRILFHSLRRAGTPRPVVSLARWESPVQSADEPQPIFRRDATA